MLWESMWGSQMDSKSRGLTTKSIVMQMKPEWSRYASHSTCYEGALQLLAMQGWLAMTEES